MPVEMALPTFESQCDEIARAEQGEGWLSQCERDGRFLVAARELVTALSGFLQQLEARPVLELCAGTGELGAALAAKGVDLVATDADPPPGAPVIRASADDALRRYQPEVVLGCFVPIDAGVDQLVMGFPSVRHYVVLGARIGGIFGSNGLWHSPGWSGEPLEEIRRWMLTRHDVWLPKPSPGIARHGEAWHFHRNQSSD